MSGHTKGPWQHGHMMDGENVWIGPDCKAIPVAYVDRDPQRARDEWEANARLIAAAPDLLKACSDWIAWLEPGAEWREDAFDHEQAMLDAMRAAIRKARGELQ